MSTVLVQSDLGHSTVATILGDGQVLVKVNGEPARTVSRKKARKLVRAAVKAMLDAALEPQEDAA